MGCDSVLLGSPRGAASAGGRGTPSDRCLSGSTWHLGEHRGNALASGGVWDCLPKVEPESTRFNARPLGEVVKRYNSLKKALKSHGCASASDSHHTTHVSKKVKP
jgi:hypothetical protein